MAVPQQIQQVFADWEQRDRPAQLSVGWQRERWLAQLPQLAATFNALPDRLDRQTVRAIATGAPVTADGMFDVLIAVYAWGWSMTAIGVGRASTVLGAERELVGARLLAARTWLHAEGPLAGYWALARESRIKGLGPSFGTKYLYFASPDTERALILDRLVCDWLRDEVGVVISPTRWTRSGYQRYLDLMEEWAQELEVEAHVLEEIVFTSEATRRGLYGWGEGRAQ